jgi:Cu/Ag efflux protein CusF
MTRGRIPYFALSIVGLTLALVGTPASAQTKEATAKSAKKEFAFKGTVQKVDAKAKALTVAGENVPGWMGAMTMLYGVDDAAVLEQIKTGDKITATVREGDFQKLYGVKVAPPAPAKK